MTKSDLYKKSWTPERKATFSEFRKGQKHSQDTIKKMKASALALNRHFSHTRETRKKMSMAHKGKPLTEAQRLKHGDIRRGAILTPETRLKISNSLKGNIISEETRKKMSNSLKGKPKPEGFAIKEKNSRWKGGISFEPYCQSFDRPFKRSTRLRQGNICAFPNCGKTKEQNLNKDMSIHHVYTEKMACCETEIKEMDTLRRRFPPEIAKFGNQNFSEEEIKHIRIVVPLCISHHGMVNTRKECDALYGETEYRKYFTELIQNKYGGKPFYTKEELKQLEVNRHVNKEQQCEQKQKLKGE
jgi:hypothetical protein